MLWLYRVCSLWPDICKLKMYVESVIFHKLSIVAYLIPFRSLPFNKAPRELIMKHDSRIWWLKVQRPHIFIYIFFESISDRSVNISPSIKPFHYKFICDSIRESVPDPVLIFTFELFRKFLEYPFHRRACVLHKRLLWTFHLWFYLLHNYAFR